MYLVQPNSIFFHMEDDKKCTHKATTIEHHIAELNQTVN